MRRQERSVVERKSRTTRGNKQWFGNPSPSPVRCGIRCRKITRDIRIMAKCASGRISHPPAPPTRPYIFPGILFFFAFFKSLLENNNHGHYGCGGCGTLCVLLFSAL